MDGLKKNIASAQDDLMDQKNDIQDAAELGETAATIAAKLPVDPQTVIETVVTARKIRSQLSDYIMPIMVVLVSVVAAGVSYQMYSQKSKQD